MEMAVMNLLAGDRRMTETRGKSDRVSDARAH